MSAPNPSPQAWSVETMQMINGLTKGIDGKAFEPGWFLLRQRLEQADLFQARAEAVEAELEETENRVDEEWLNAIGVAWKLRTGQSWETRDGETREEGVSHNIGALFNAFDEQKVELERVRKACAAKDKVLKTVVDFACAEDPDWSDLDGQMAIDALEADVGQKDYHHKDEFKSLLYALQSANDVICCDVFGDDPPILGCKCKSCNASAKVRAALADARAKGLID